MPMLRHHICKSASEAAKSSLDLLPGLFHLLRNLLRNLLSLPARQWIDLEICMCICWNFGWFFLRFFRNMSVSNYAYEISSLVDFITCCCCRNPKPTSPAFWVRPGHQLHPPLADSGITQWWQRMLLRVPPSMKLANAANLRCPNPIFWKRQTSDAILKKTKYNQHNKTHFSQGFWIRK